MEARAQLLAEVKLKELCKQPGVPAPQDEPPSVVHPTDEGILREKAVPTSGEESHEGPVERRPAKYIKGCSEDNPNTADDRSKKGSKTPGTTKAVIGHDTRCYGSW